jgi:carbon starvation protein CstA
MSKKRNSLFQLFKIAGIGPIVGALYVTVAFIWIVIG